PFKAHKSDFGEEKQTRSSTITNNLRFRKLRLIWEFRVFFLRRRLQRTNSDSPMTLPPGLYSGTSSLALVARASAFGIGLVYGNMKLKVLKIRAKSPKMVEANAHH
ncbi:unnamed protein product, partial [Thlaspi arvense]